MVPVVSKYRLTRFAQLTLTPLTVSKVHTCLDIDSSNLVGFLEATVRFLNTSPTYPHNLQRGYQNKIEV